MPLINEDTRKIIEAWPEELSDQEKEVLRHQLQRVDVPDSEIEQWLKQDKRKH